MKKNILFTLLLALLYSCSNVKEENSKIDLCFNEDGTFKILQMTDLHWDENEEGKPEALSKMIIDLVKMEKPDLIVATGDVITERPAMKGWEKLTAVLADCGVPYAITMGNHDPEAMGRDSIFDFLATQPLSVAEKGPAEISGVGNYILEVKASDGSGKTKALLYCFDSGDYTIDRKKYGYYAWFEQNQIEWYKKQSQRYTNANGGEPLPALGFFHIPLPEYNDVKDYERFGEWHERICSPSFNTGMFLAMRQMGDIMGTFVGHDHSNDFIGKYWDIALAYGRRTQTDFDEITGGGRIIILKEDQRSFETYARTLEKREYTYYYPQAFPSDDYEPLKPAKNVNPVKNGVSYTYYEGNFNNTDEMLAKGKLVGKGTMDYFFVDKAPIKDYYGYEFNAYIYIPEDGFYRFFMDSDDGSKIFLDDELLINLDVRSVREKTGGNIGLAKGFHEIKILYYENYAGQELTLDIASMKMPRQKVSAEMLYVK